MRRYYFCEESSLIYEVVAEDWFSDNPFTDAYRTYRDKRCGIADS